MRRTIIAGLRLAAAPTFAALALVSALSGGGAAEILCRAADGLGPITGMTAMYALMSVFHLPAGLALRGGSARKERRRFRLP